MANDHAQDRYDPPSTGSEFEEEKFSEVNPSTKVTEEFGYIAEKLKNIEDNSEVIGEE